MNLLAWLFVGGVIGWLASLVMRTDGQQGIVLNLVVGIVGALKTRLRWFEVMVHLGHPVWSTLAPFRAPPRAGCIGRSKRRTSEVTDARNVGSFLRGAPVKCR